MVQLLTKTYSFEEYLVYDDGTDNKYELVNGELKIMPTASGFHALILHFIFTILEQEIHKLKQQWKVMPGTVGVRTAKNLKFLMLQLKVSRTITLLIPRGINVRTGSAKSLVMHQKRSMEKF